MAGIESERRTFFARARKEPAKLKTAKLVAFSSTRRKGRTAATDENILRLVAAQTPVVCVFGKIMGRPCDSTRCAPRCRKIWKIIRDTVSFLKSKKKEVIYDAEHFFDGF